MYFKEKDLISSKNMIGFTMPRLHKGVHWYVDFYAYDPVRDKMRRKKYMLDRYRTKKIKCDMACLLIHNVFEKLKLGWNPFTESCKTRQFTCITLVITRYRLYLETSKNKKILRSKTAIDYNSRINQLANFLVDYKVNIKYIYQFDCSCAIDFLDYLLYDKDVSATTRNNYRTWLSTFASWLVERQYIDNNFVENIKMVKETAKKRDALSQHDLSVLHSYLIKNNPAFYLACMMEYYTFIRPDELRYIKIGDISIENQTVFINSNISKNRKSQYVALNDSVLKIMIEQHIFNYPSSSYIFSNNHLVPGDELIYTNRFRVEWVKVRTALHFPDSYQFYSLKDSGIRDLANAEGIVVARDQARHSDISVTNRYLKDQGIAHDETKHYKGNL